MSSANVEQFLKACTATNNLQALNLCLNDADNLKSLVQVINKCISAAATRSTGFEYLSTVLPHLSQSTLSENATHWLNICINPSQKNIIVNSNPHVIGQIILASKNIQEFNKSITSTYLLKIIDVCIQSTNDQSAIKSKLECLEICLKTYPSSCGPVKNKIEKFLLSLLDFESSSIQKHAGRCLHYLQQTGGAGARNSNHIYNWCQTIKHLCKSIHSTYDQFFEDITEFGEYTVINVDGFNLPTLQNASGTQSSLLVFRRLQNLTIYLQAFVETAYPVQKDVPILTILNVIKRGLSIHQCFFNVNNFKSNSEFAILLAEHQKLLLRLLGSVIAALQQNLIPFSLGITKLFVDLLKRMQSCSCFTVNETIHETYHKVFQYWISVSKSTINSVFHEKLILLLINEIEPSKNDLCLNINTSLSSHSSSKAKKKAITEQITKSQTSNGLMSNTTNFKSNVICSYALQTLTSLFTNVTLNISRKTLQKLYEMVFTTLQSIQNDKCLSPYNDQLCKSELYTLLLAIIMQPVVVLAIPLKTCVNIFSKGLQDPENLIQKVSYEAIIYLEGICQPTCPTLYVEKLSNDDEKNDKDEIAFETEELETCNGKSLSEDIEETIQNELKKETIRNELKNKSNVENEDSVEEMDVDATQVVENDSLYVENNSLKVENRSINCEDDVSVIYVETMPRKKDEKQKSSVKILYDTEIKANENGETSENSKTPKSRLRNDVISISDNDSDDEDYTPKKPKVDLEDTVETESDNMLESFVDEINEDD